MRIRKRPLTICRAGAKRETAGVVEHSDVESRSADGSKARYHEEDLLAYISPHIFFGSEVPW
jgi:hypothetical protein